MKNDEIKLAVMDVAGTPFLAEKHWEVFTRAVENEIKIGRKQIVDEISSGFIKKQFGIEL